MVNEQKLDDEVETAEFIKKLQPIIVSKLYEEYQKIQEKQNKSLTPEAIEEIKKLTNDPFGRIRYKVMKATSALPTEDRVKKMNDVQWIWYYLNIVKDNEELDIEDKNKLDYLTFFINPQLSEEINKNRKNISGKTDINDSNIQKNDFFEDEFKRALMEAGISEDDFTELPSSEMAGDPYESEADFIERVKNQQFNDEFFNQSQNFNEENDIDYFEYPEEDME